MSALEVCPVRALQAGDRFIDVDEEGLVDEEVNERYDADDQEWVEVLAVHPQGDRVSLTIRTPMHPGRDLRTPAFPGWEPVWRLVP